MVSESWVIENDNKIRYVQIPSNDIKDYCCNDTILWSAFSKIASRNQVSDCYYNYDILPNLLMRIVSLFIKYTMEETLPESFR